MIDRQGGKVLIECDSCDDVFEGEEGDEFAQAFGAAKREGWKARRVVNEWMHFCSNCNT